MKPWGAKIQVPALYTDPLNEAVMLRAPLVVQKGAGMASRGVIHGNKQQSTGGNTKPCIASLPPKSFRLM